MISSNPADNLLAPDEAQRIFDKEILPRLLRNVRVGVDREERPIAMLLTAQPGAGKSTIARRIQQVRALDDPMVFFDADGFRPYHPKYAEAKAHSWEIEDAVVLGDARRWFEMAFDALTEKGVDFIAETGMRPEVADRYLDRLADPPAPTEPYRTEVVILATSPGESLLGMLDRYNEAVKQIGYGRYPGEIEHNQRLARLPELGDQVDADPRISGRRIYRRDGLFDYNKRDPETGAWSSTEPTRSVIARAQETRLTLPESRVFTDKLEQLAAELGPDWVSQIENVKQAAATIIHPAISIDPALLEALGAVQSGHEVAPGQASSEKSVTEREAPFSDPTVGLEAGDAGAGI
ncbi:zeta toxin family protein [Nocardia sp. XZ_19_231]|uniref:zeta toxin family protein n=1 Tax=Nocardia sp. XZ_19_231 TaxID=2769252 RepID=UPI0018908B61